MELLLLSLESADVSHERVDLFFIQLVGECRHVAAHVSTIHDRVKNAFVAYVSLPLRICQVARVAKSSFGRFSFAIAAMTRDAIAAVRLRSGPVSRSRCKYGEAQQSHESKKVDSHRQLIILTRTRRNQIKFKPQMGYDGAVIPVTCKSGQLN